MRLDELGHGEGATRTAIFQLVADQALARVRQTWPSIEAIAVELLRDRRVEGPRVVEIVHGTIDQWKQAEPAA